MGLLSLVTFLPIVGAAVLAALPKPMAKLGALGVSLLTFVASVPLWLGFDPATTVGGNYAFVEGGPTNWWIEPLGVTWHLGIDGVSLLLILLTTLLTPIIVAAGFSGVEEDGQRGYFSLMLLLEGAMIGTFVALDTFVFYLFWELVLIPMYFLVGIWGGQRRIYAAVKFFIYTVVGSLLMLVAFIGLYYHAAGELGHLTTNLPELLKVGIPHEMQLWMFACFALAFAIKVPMFPVHTWLPDAHVEAPTGGSVVLAGVMLKMGTYGFYRFAMPLFPEAVTHYGPFLIALSVVGIVYGALVAMVQDDVKKLVAYSSVSHMGYVMLGLFALNAQGIGGAVYQMLNHGVSTGALFLLVGVLYERRHTRAIAEYGGLSKVVPLFAVVFMIVTFSSIGLPGLNGFVGEFLIMLGAFQYAPLPTVVAVSGVIFGATYMLWCFQRMMFGPLKNRANAALQDLNLREVLYLAPLVVLVFVMGIFPNPLLERINPSVDALVARLGTAYDATGDGPYAAAGPVPSWVGPVPAAPEGQADAAHGDTPHEAGGHEASGHEGAAPAEAGHEAAPTAEGAAPAEAGHEAAPAAEGAAPAAGGTAPEGTNAAPTGNGE